jgi:DNA polymerase III subunit alpha
MAGPSFIHLGIRTDYSLLEGAIHVKDAVKWAKKHGMPALAVTDSANLFASLEFAQAAAGEGIQPIMGCTLFIKPVAVQDSRNHVTPVPEHLVIYAKNEQGWNNMLALASKAYLEPAGGVAPLLTMDDVAAHADGLIALTSGVQGTIGKALLAGREALATEALAQLMQLFPGSVYVDIARHGLPEEKATEAAFVAMAYEHNLPLIAVNHVYFLDEETYEAHDAFLCIAEGAYVSQETRRRLTPEHRLKNQKEMAKLFADLPEALAGTIHLAKRCTYFTKGKAPILPTFSIEGMSEEDSLRMQARKGLEDRLQRYVFKDGMTAEEKDTIAKPYWDRLEFELETIIKMKFPGYFLIVSDFISWSKAHDIPVGPGRGSGAGSLVAWALLITDLDPLRYGLLFERFLNPQRVSMPDFDIDFCQDRREEVIRYVQQKYGTDRVAQIITFGKLQARAVLRDVGRVLQMPYGQVDKICKLVPNNPAAPVTLAQAIDIEPMLKQAIEDEEAVAKLVDISLKLEGFNRHASTHAAGVVIGDRPLSELVPMYRDPKSEMPVVQYSMKYAEAAGLVKFDFLGLKTLTVLSRAVMLVKHRGVTLDLLALPEGDKPSYELLGRGDTVGVFQLESAGMRDTLKKLRPDTLEDIIALVSLYRPGPMDNIPTYIARKHGEEQPQYLHALLEQVLKETFGVIIYQEQVMQIAQLLAGYSLGEADLLRRAMGKKIKSEMEAQRDIFVQRSVERGVPEKQAASIFDLIAKFAEYGFNKSHAAAYALIAYQTAFIKANYPVEFFAASMTYDMHNTDKLGIFREDAQRLGVNLLPPDVNASEVLFSVEPMSADGRPSGAVRYALAAIRNVGAQAMEGVVAERRANGPFKDIFDFASRVPADALNKRALEHLIKAGAFDSLHPNRGQLFANLELVAAHGNTCQRDRETQQVSLFGGGSTGPAHVPAMATVNDWSALEKLENEFSAIGFYLSAHPLEGYASALDALGVTQSTTLPTKLTEQYRAVKVAGIVTGRKFKSSDKGRFAFVQLSDRGGIFEVSIFNEMILSQRRDNLENGKILLIQADGKADESGVRLIAQSVSLLDDALMKLQRTRGGGVYTITIAQPDALAPLQQLLGSPNGQGALVKLRAALDGTVAEIELPGKYAISPATLDKIRVVRGVITAEEAAA